MYNLTKLFLKEQIHIKKFVAFHFSSPISKTELVYKAHKSRANSPYPKRMLTRYFHAVIKRDLNFIGYVFNVEYMIK